VTRKIVEVREHVLGTSRDLDALPDWRRHFGLLVVDGMIIA